MSLSVSFSFSPVLALNSPSTIAELFLRLAILSFVRSPLVLLRTMFSTVSKSVLCDLSLSSSSSLLASSSSLSSSLSSSDPLSSPESLSLSIMSNNVSSFSSPASESGSIFSFLAKWSPNSLSSSLLNASSSLISSSSSIYTFFFCLNSTLSLSDSSPSLVDTRLTTFFFARVLLTPLRPMMTLNKTKPARTNRLLFIQVSQVFLTRTTDENTQPLTSRSSFFDSSKMRAMLQLTPES
mmetsp:Transcript_37625/g.61218  ORF Transcript_37625/g.61218 Transcript_37625/m.61218 type:complete len:238 (+) Transcript_37625:15002-15715(+)